MNDDTKKAHMKTRIEEAKSKLAEAAEIVKELDEEQTSIKIEAALSELS